MENTVLTGTELLKEITRLDTGSVLVEPIKRQTLIAYESALNSVVKRHSWMCRQPSVIDQQDDDIPVSDLALAESVYGQRLLDVIDFEIPTENEEVVD